MASVNEATTGAPDDHPRDRYIRPVTILRARYGPSNWLALPIEPWETPRNPFEDDNVAFAWYEHAGLQSFNGAYGGVTAPVPIGVGHTPNEAHEDLYRRLQAIPPASGNDRYSLYLLFWPDGRTTEVSIGL